MPLLPEHKELLAEFREGRPEALERVYRHYVGSVARVLRSGFVFTSAGATVTSGRVESPFELENLVQEVFARAFEDRTRLAYDGVRPYLDFLLGIGKHVALSDLRRRRSLDPAADVEAVAAEAPETLEDQLHAKHAQDLVREFLQQACDERDRRLYALRYRHEQTQEAAAQAAGLTRIQLRRWETKFRARLLRYLKRVKYLR